MDKERLLGFVEGFKNQNIFVIGDVGLDLYTDGTVDRISPEAPVPIINITSTWSKLGLAGNVAENIATLGGTPSLFSVTGDDPDGWQIEDMLQKANIQNEMISSPKRVTTLKHRILSGHHHHVRLDLEMASDIGTDLSWELMMKVESALKKVKHPIIIVQDYSKGVINGILYNWLSAKCETNKYLLLVDPSPKKDSIFYKYCTFITPNQKEAQELTGMRITDEASVFNIGQVLCERSKAIYCAMTRGEKGISLIGRGEREAIHIPTFAQSVFDVSGAGDTVIAAMALGLAVGATPYEACVLGNAAAGVVVGKIGTANVSTQELIQAITRL